jgi:hypothetical protein
MGTVSTNSLSRSLSLEIGTGVEIIILIFKRSIRAEEVTYGLDAVLGSLHMQQVYGFHELRNDQGVIRKRSAKIDTVVVALYLSASNLNFRLLPLAKIIE